MSSLRLPAPPVVVGTFSGPYRHRRKSCAEAGATFAARSSGLRTRGGGSIRPHAAGRPGASRGDCRSSSHDPACYARPFDRAVRRILDVLQLGATLINADIRRNPIEVVDLLVHESSHLLLFAFSSQSALTKNAGTERYSSPVRSDPRPIDGIFHACFVTTRVHLAMKRLIGSGGSLPRRWRQLEGHWFTMDTRRAGVPRSSETSCRADVGRRSNLAELDKYWVHEAPPVGWRRRKGAARAE